MHKTLLPSHIISVLALVAIVFFTMLHSQQMLRLSDFVWDRGSKQIGMFQHGTKMITFSHASFSPVWIMKQRHPYTWLQRYSVVCRQKLTFKILNFMWFISANSLVIVQELINAGANLNARTLAGYHFSRMILIYHYHEIHYY